jgi:hypothetical protein
LTTANLISAVELREGDAALLKGDLELEGQLDDRCSRDSGQTIVSMWGEKLSSVIL